MSQTWQGIRQEVERRLRHGVWKPGDVIPSEMMLSDEFDCARATVNRALQSLANEGLLERKRKAGTRVTATPTRRALFKIPMLREEIEATGATYEHRLIARRLSKATRSVSDCMALEDNQRLLHLRALHLANDEPYCLEDRWINPQAVSDLDSVDFAKISANEFLLKNIPYTKGDLSLGAALATANQARLLAVDPATALFEMSRTTWFEGLSVTTATLLFPPGYKLQTTL